VVCFPDVLQNWSLNRVTDEKDFGREQVSGATMEIPNSSLSPHGDVILDKLHVLQPTSYKRSCQLNLRRTECLALFNVISAVHVPYIQSILN
jgi:hypothetical protein